MLEVTPAVVVSVPITLAAALLPPSQLPMDEAVPEG